MQKSPRVLRVYTRAFLHKLNDIMRNFYLGGFSDHSFDFVIFPHSGKDV
jgi:hypothetical protein